jgi:hypothetical protein
MIGSITNGKYTRWRLQILFCPSFFFSAPTPPTHNSRTPANIFTGLSSQVLGRFQYRAIVTETAKKKKRKKKKRKIESAIIVVRDK